MKRKNLDPSKWTIECYSMPTMIHPLGKMDHRMLLHAHHDPSPAFLIRLKFLNPPLQPRLSQKHHEIMYAIKIHNCNMVRKSLEHNEYLAEMSDALTGKLLLHQIALHGSNAPVLLIDLIYDTYPSGV